MGKTPEYMKKATNAYRQKNDTFSIVLPSGYKEKIKDKAQENNISVNAYIKMLVDADINN